MQSLENDFYFGSFEHDFTQWFDEENWIKSMYTEYIIYNFLVAIGLHVYDSSNNTKQKKIEKILQCPSIKSPLLRYGSGFFFKNTYYYTFLIKQMQKNIFFEWNFIQKL